MKEVRHKAILELLRESPIGSQDELQRALGKRGIRVGQATLSRDIHELELVKTPEGYELPSGGTASEAALPSASRLVREFVLDVRQAQNLVVVKTAVGSAQPVAAALDGESWPEVVGTIAGDDAILIVAANNKNAARLAQRVRGLLAGRGGECKPRYWEQAATPAWSWRGCCSGIHAWVLRCFCAAIQRMARMRFRR